MNLIKICILVILLFPFLTNAQESFTSKKSKFGISLEVNSSNNAITLGDPEAINSAGFNDIEAQNSLGFGLGVMYKYQFNSFLAGRAQGIIFFTENKFLYKDGFANFLRKKESVRLEFPVHLVFEKTDKKIAPSFLLGGRYSYDLAEAERSNLGSFRQEDFLLDFGVGVAFEFKLFKFKPELVYSRGVINQVHKDSNVPLNALDKAFSERFSLRFLFYN